MFNKKREKYQNMIVYVILDCSYKPIILFIWLHIFLTIHNIIVRDDILLGLEWACENSLNDYFLSRTIIWNQSREWEIQPILTFDIYTMSTRQVVKKKITSTKRMLSQRNFKFLAVIKIHSCTKKFIEIKRICSQILVVKTTFAACFK